MKKKKALPRKAPIRKLKTAKKKKVAKKVSPATDIKPTDPSNDNDLSNLGRQPTEFFVQRYGANHFRVIDNMGFVFSGGRWVSVDVDGFTYTPREILPGDPDFVAV